MRPSIHQRPSSLRSIAKSPTLLLSLVALIQPILANPYPKDDLHNSLGIGFLMDRSCATYCGVDNQYCCSEGQACTTSGTIAGCTDTAYGGGYALYTTTWTETDTFTSTLSSYYAVTTASAGGTCTPPAGSSQIACGSICCASWQYCAYDGQCSANAGSGTTTTAVAGGGGGAATTAITSYKTTITSAGSTITTQYSAPYRVTSGSETASTTSNTAFLESATSTGSGNGTAVTTGGSSLSGGAIAGIVIGVIAGVVILLAICACCIMRGLWHGLLAIFGLGPRKKQRSRSHDRETIIIEEERYARHGGPPIVGGAASAARDRHDSWFAARPARSSRAAATDSRRVSQSEKRRESTNAGWMGAGAMGTMLGILGLRQNQKRKAEQQARRTSRRPSRRARSEVSSSYFEDSYTASSPSELSSDYTYASDYTRPPQPHAAHARDVRPEPDLRDAGRGRREYYKSNVPHHYAGSASSGGMTRDTRRSRRTETTRVSRGR
ncbi:hypothetical protein VP1G_05137 [Cytospora mali]|uniref:Carcinoembryonic antigen-related cell adhesion molecule 1 n=1 Tax=Cytospora mali TaxID=578113 RepID=A0A194V208_CYTMA|nr:hypothetical protein VP1G_05137 [Valsa mali var. pyri (nom. inval.)]